MPKALSSAERVFVFEYLLNRNAAEAAVAAGFPAAAGRVLVGRGRLPGTSRCCCEGGDAA